MFDIYARNLLLTEFERTAESKIRNRIMYQMLEKAGGEFTKPFKTAETYHPGYWCDSFESEMQELVMFPEMIDCEF